MAIIKNKKVSYSSTIKKGNGLNTQFYRIDNATNKIYMVDVGLREKYVRRLFNRKR